MSPASLQGENPQLFPQAFPYVFVIRGDGDGGRANGRCGSPVRRPSASVVRRSRPLKQTAAAAEVKMSSIRRFVSL